jgi:hypothetical protein
MKEETKNYFVVTSENTLNELSNDNYSNKGKILEFSLRLKIPVWYIFFIIIVGEKNENKLCVYQSFRKG